MAHAPWIITCDELLTEQTRVKLVDVREPEEHEDLRIGGEILIPLGELEGRAEHELPNLEEDIVVYCAHGVRSLWAVRALQAKGYTRVRSLDGGIAEWIATNPGQPRTH
jgi:rhodanese-related sulfurtransferase